MSLEPFEGIDDEEDQSQAADSMNAELEVDPDIEIDTGEGDNDGSRRHGAISKEEDKQKQPMISPDRPSWQKGLVSPGMGERRRRSTDGSRTAHAAYNEDAMPRALASTSATGYKFPSSSPTPVTPSRINYDRLRTASSPSVPRIDSSHGHSHYNLSSSPSNHATASYSSPPLSGSSPSLTYFGSSASQDANHSVYSSKFVPPRRSSIERWSSAMITGVPNVPTSPLSPSFPLTKSLPEHLNGEAGFLSSSPPTPVPPADVNEPWITLASTSTFNDIKGQSPVLAAYSPFSGHYVKFPSITTFTTDTSINSTPPKAAVHDPRLAAPTLPSDPMSLSLPPVPVHSPTDHSGSASGNASPLSKGTSPPVSSDETRAPASLPQLPQLPSFLNLLTCASEGRPIRKPEDLSMNARPSFRALSSASIEEAAFSSRKSPNKDNETSNLSRLSPLSSSAPASSSSALGFSRALSPHYLERASPSPSVHFSDTLDRERELQREYRPTHDHSEGYLRSVSPQGITRNTAGSPGYRERSSHRRSPSLGHREESLILRSPKNSGGPFGTPPPYSAGLETLSPTFRTYAQNRDYASDLAATPSSPPFVAAPSSNHTLSEEYAPDPPLSNGSSVRIPSPPPAMVPYQSMKSKFSPNASPRSSATNSPLRQLGLKQDLSLPPPSGWNLSDDADLSPSDDSEDGGDEDQQEDREEDGEELGLELEKEEEQQQEHPTMRDMRETKGNETKRHSRRRSHNLTSLPGSAYRSYGSHGGYDETTGLPVLADEGDPIDLVAGVDEAPPSPLMGSIPLPQSVDSDQQATATDRWDTPFGSDGQSYQARGFTEGWTHTGDSELIEGEYSGKAHSQESVDLGSTEIDEAGLTP